MKLNIETLEQFAADCDLLLSDNLINFAGLVSQAVEYEIKAKKPVKAKAPDLPENWQGNGRYKLLDKTTNTHFETTFEEALLHKGLTAKKAFTVKADTRDRPKDFAGNWIAQYGRENNISGYVKAFLQANHLKVA
jgi:hypothetical protein